ncbi:hypothetical protein LC087_04550 [Bacillus carboniphilus]|uniref:Spore coat protein n=1 Tax=Bacillus carboniphilus TaxID=86663 RepID=A0ABY9JVL1_9BACI|nr:hypothetical protein [Bacillus carboniphilus]WLR43447.1 hypothetical protein LC087_04550 [Bacillus carboniphilus]
MDDNQGLNLKEVEQWMDQFLEDPFTTFLDEAMFPVYLYEMCETYLIEAQVPTSKLKNIDIYIQEQQSIIIQLKNEPTISREIILPIQLQENQINYQFKDQVLQVLISKKME